MREISDSGNAFHYFHIRKCPWLSPPSFKGDCAETSPLRSFTDCFTMSPLPAQVMTLFSNVMHPKQKLFFIDSMPLSMPKFSSNPSIKVQLIPDSITQHRKSKSHDSIKKQKTKQTNNHVFIATQVMSTNHLNLASLPLTTTDSHEWDSTNS